MISVFVDTRQGSDELIEPLRKLQFEVVATTLTYGDVAFIGKGAKGTLVSIGIEFKKLPDLAQSLKDGRLTGHQLPGMLGPQGQYDEGWLLLEGRYQTNPQGQVMVPKWSRGHHREEWYPLQPTMLTSQLEKRVLTLELCDGVHVRFTNTRRDTLGFLSNLLHWWTDKALDEHTSHLHSHQPLGFLQISPFRAAVQQWPGISLGTSLAVEQHFGASLRKAAMAGVTEWAGIQTVDRSTGKLRRFGVKRAEKVVAFCEGQ